MQSVMRAVYVAFGCVLFLVGCGGGGSNQPTLAPVKGTVTYNGAPVAGATVTFMPDKGPLAIGVTGLNGEFKLNSGALPGCSVGHCKAGVRLESPGEDTSSSAIPKPGTSGDISEQSKMMAQMTMSAQQSNAGKSKSLIPNKYRDINNSGLEFTVDSSSAKNDFKIELKD